MRDCFCEHGVRGGAGLDTARCDKAALVFACTAEWRGEVSADGGGCRRFFECALHQLM